MGILLLLLAAPGLGPLVDGEVGVDDIADTRTPEEWLRAARSSRPGRGDGEGAAGAARGVRVHRVELRVGGRAETTSIVTYVPERVERPAPALLYLHGSGGRGEEALNLWRATADALGMIVIAPTEAGENAGYGFTERERGAALAALRWARRRFDIDENRIHLTGVSRGGHMAWDLATRHPDLWASVSPMIGGPRWLPHRGQNNIRFLENVATLPIRDLQGEKDQRGLLQNLRYAFRKLDELGATDARLITFPDRGHSFEMGAIDWPAFLRGAARDANPERVVLRCTGKARSAWVEVLAVKRSVKETFTPRVDGRKWPGLDAMEQRAYMNALVEKHTARIEARRTGKGRFEVRSKGVRKFRLLLAPGTFDPDEPVVVTWNGRARKNRVEPSAKVLLEDFAGRFDRRFVPVAALTIP